MIKDMLCPSKIKIELRWSPKYGFNIAFENTVDWRLKNINWCKRLSKKNIFMKIT